MALFLPTDELLLLGGGSIFTASHQQCTVLEQLKAQLIERAGEDINASSLLTGNPAFQPQTGDILSTPANHRRIFTLFFTRRSQTNGGVVDQYAVGDRQQHLENRLLALKPSVQKDEQMYGERLDGVILTAPFDLHLQAMQIVTLQIGQ